MKRICYLTRSTGDWGGASRYLITLLQGLNRSEFEPLLLLPKSGPIVSLLDNMGTEYQIWGRETEPSGLNWTYARRVLAAALFFYRNQIDILHINHASYWRPAEIVGALMARVPIITHFHTVSKQTMPFLRFCDLVIANSHFTATSSNSGGVPKQVIHNFVDLRRYDAAKDIRSELGFGQDEIVVSFIGQIREIKGVDLFIRMMRQVKYPMARFLIVGKCRDKTRFRDAYSVDILNEEIATENRCRYIGYRSDVENIYRSSDVVVVPSRWQEPFGLVNIEAGAAGKPVIATRVGGIPEIIEHGENGFLIDSEDVSELAACVNRLVENAALRRLMGEKGRRIVEKRFAQTRIRELEDAYRTVIDNRRTWFRQAMGHRAHG